MLETIRQNDKNKYVVVAKLLTGTLPVEKKVADTAAFLLEHELFDADFVASVCAWQRNHDITPDGIIGKNTWKAIAKNAPTCSTSKNKTSGYTLACQLLLGGNLDCDAIYGSRTKAAVAAFQEAAGLQADGICGPKTWSAIISGKKEDAKGKVINECVHYLQWDKRWKNIKYSTHTSKQTIGNSGCGPTAMAQIMATWIDLAITPVQMCELAIEGGYRTYDSGTSGGFFKYVYKKYDGFSKFVQTGSVETIKAALTQGALAVCCMNSNDNHFWTSGGCR